MKTLALSALALFAALLTGCVGPQSTGCCAMDTQEHPVKHIVLFQFKPAATPEQVKQITDAFAALPKQIPQIQRLEWGTNVSPEKLNDGLTHAWIVTFKDAADRDAYLVHPAHQKFVALLKPQLEKATVVDFVAQ